MIAIEKEAVLDEKPEHSLRYCRKEDVLIAFMAVGAEIGSKCGRFAIRGITLPEACQLAGRIRELTPGAVVRAHALFTYGREPWCNSMF